MSRRLTSSLALLTIVLFFASLQVVPVPNGSMSPMPHLQPATCDLPSSSSFLMLNSPALVVQSPSGEEVSLTWGTHFKAEFYGADQAADFLKDTIDRDLYNAIKASGADTKINISADRRHATLKDGQTVYYVVKLLPAGYALAEKVTFVLTTVPKSGIPDITNNYFKIKYAMSPAGGVGQGNIVTEDDSTSGKAYQVINPAGEKLWYFAFTAVAKTGGIETTIETHFFKGPSITEVIPQYIQCCCEHVKTPLLKVPEPQRCFWYYIPYVGDLFLAWYRWALYCKVAQNTANVPCTHGEATGKEMTIKGDRLRRFSDTDILNGLKITDDCGQEAARVAEVTSVTNDEIKVKIDITACKPGVKTVKLNGAGGLATVTFLKVVQDVPDTIVTQKRFTAVRIFGTQEKMQLTMTLAPGEDGQQNIVYADNKYQIYNVTCMTRCSDTMMTGWTTGKCANILTDAKQAMPVPGEDIQTASNALVNCSASMLAPDVKIVDKDGKRVIVAKKEGVSPGGENAVDVTVVDVAAGDKVILLIQRVGGTSGSATFKRDKDSTPENTTFIDDTTAEITSPGVASFTRTFILKGGEVSSTPWNVKLIARPGADATAVFDNKSFTIFWVVLDSPKEFHSNTSELPDYVQNESNDPNSIGLDGQPFDAKILRNIIKNFSGTFVGGRNISQTLKVSATSIFVRGTIIPKGESLTPDDFIKDNSDKVGFNFRRFRSTRTYLGNVPYDTIFLGGIADNKDDDGGNHDEDLFADRDNTTDQLFIYDTDVVTVGFEYTPVVGDVFRMRSNFTEHVLYNEVRCSDDFKWFSAHSFKRVATGVEEDKTYNEGIENDDKGDNEIGPTANGIKLTPDLQEGNITIPFIVSAISPEQIVLTPAELTDVLISGNNFPKGTAPLVVLEPMTADAPDVPISNVKRIGPTAITCNFDLRGIPKNKPAKYRVRVTFGKDSFVFFGPFRAIGEFDHWSFIYLGKGAEPNTYAPLVAPFDKAGNITAVVVSPTLTQSGGTATLVPLGDVVRRNDGAYGRKFRVDATGTAQFKCEGSGKTAESAMVEIK